MSKPKKHRNKIGMAPYQPNHFHIATLQKYEWCKSETQHRVFMWNSESG